jgi:leucine dehydrogenase
MGAILNDETIPRLQARVVAGAANNQLAEARHGDLMQHMNVLYAPDYVINAGGVINCYYDYISRAGKVAERKDVLSHVDRIGPTVEAIFRRAEQESIPTALAADRLAEQRFMKDPPGPQQSKSVCA